MAKKVLMVETYFLCTGLQYALKNCFSLHKSCNFIIKKLKYVGWIVVFHLNIILLHRNLQLFCILTRGLDFLTDEI